MAKGNKQATAKSGTALAVLAALGAVSALWALFLWTELVRSRAGGTPFCGFGGGDCAALWDAAFAAAVHRLTGLPVAAWGLVWGGAAFAVPILALAALADGRGAARLLGAVRWTAIGGLAGLVALLAASAAEGLFCTSCALTYVLALAYGGVAFFVLAPRRPLRPQGLATAAVASAGVWVLLLYPGLETPKSLAREDQRAMAGAAARAAERGETPPASESPPTAQRAADGERDPRLEQQLPEFLASLEPQLKQSLSDTLAVFREGERHEEPPRALQGSADAPVRITEFTDALCSHCATLHGTINYLRTLLPADAFSVDSRQFPLDGNCNDKLPARGPESVRCLAARAQICMEDTEHAFEFAGAVFERQRDLTREIVYEIAAPFMDRSRLSSCVESSETAAKLAADVDYAWHFEPHGTPLVLVNGRESPSFGPLLYALVLTGGDPDHPQLSELPPPDPQAVAQLRSHSH
jgi:serine/threonine-protein kinase